MEDAQNRFEPNRIQTDANFIVCQISEKFIEEAWELRLYFIHLEKAFDRVRRQDIMNTPEKRKVDSILINGIKSLCKETINFF